MADLTAEDWRKHMKDLARNPAKLHPPVFAPLLMACAAQIDAATVTEMVNDGTQIRKNLSGLGRMLCLNAIACSVPSGLEAEALGATLDYSQWPPTIISAPDPAGINDISSQTHSRRLEASLDATRQLVSGAPDGPLLLAALTGPATLMEQMRAGNPDMPEDALYELVGQALAFIARSYAEAGINVVQVHETANTAINNPHWKGALRTIANIARFHRVPFIVALADNSQALTAAPLLAATPAPEADTYGQLFDADPAQWPSNWSPETRWISTAGDAPANFDLARLMQIVQAL